MLEGKKYCILIVTWVLLREINKYEVETHNGKLSKLFMSSYLGICHMSQNVTAIELWMTRGGKTFLKILIEEHKMRKEGPCEYVPCRMIQLWFQH